MYFAVAGITNGEEWTDIIKSEKYWRQSVQERSIMPVLFYLMRAYWGAGGGKLSMNVTERGGYFAISQPGRKLAIGVVVARTKKEAESHLPKMRSWLIKLYKGSEPELTIPERLGSSPRRRSCPDRPLL